MSRDPNHQQGAYTAEIRTWIHLIGNGVEISSTDANTLVGDDSDPYRGAKILDQLARSQPHCLVRVSTGKREGRGGRPPTIFAWTGIPFSSLLGKKPIRREYCETCFLPIPPALDECPECT